MKANSLEELVTNSNIAGELRNHTDWYTRLVKFAQLVADWQKEQDTRDMYMSDNRHFEKVYKLGKKDMKEQLLKDAVEGFVRKGYPYSKPFVDIEDSKDQWCESMKRFMNGDKVRLIVIKEDE